MAVSQEEAVRENLKNVVLFMSSSGLLVSPAENPAKQELWDETWKRVDRFLPDLRNDLAAEGADEREATGGDQEKKTDITGVDFKAPSKGTEPARKGEGEGQDHEGQDQLSQD